VISFYEQKVLNYFGHHGNGSFVQGKASPFWGIIIVNKLLIVGEVGISVGWVFFFPPNKFPYVVCDACGYDGFVQTMVTTNY
jgi:hypothetical protein